MDMIRSDKGLVYLEDKKYLAKVAEQIARDFDMSGMDLDIGNHTPESYQELFDLVYPPIHSLILSGDIQFKNLLYRIDVSEKKIHQRMLHRDESKLDELVSKMIIERCLQKVLTKEKFSQG
jgi:hypothetical protein